MNPEKIIDIVNNNPIIAAVHTREDVVKAIESPCEVVFLVNATIQDVSDLVALVHSAGKLTFVHMDLMKGLASDSEGLIYLKDHVKPDGIISTRSAVVRRAKELGFVTVQRIFVLDSKSIEIGIKQLKEMATDFVEVMPGALVKVIERMSNKLEIPIIAGGIIDDEKEVMAILKAGAVSASTSASHLWAL